MSETNINEIWQVEVGGQIYDAPFYQLPDWIAEGSLQPSDLVRKGAHRWTEARKVPSLHPFFEAKAKGMPMPLLLPAVEPSQESVDATATELEQIPVEPVADFSSAVQHSLSGTEASQQEPAFTYTPTSNPNFCRIHNGVPSEYLCNDCGNGFCRECPKAFGGTVRVCPECGGLCRPVKEVKQQTAQSNFRAAAIGEGFGINDFFNAVAHPFKFKVSLFFGAIMFAVFSVGQSASAMGGIYMAVGAIFSVMFANMLWFGVLANTVQNFSQGNLGANFMPEYEDFSLWDDVIHPLFLSIGAWLVSFGPFFVTLTIGFYLVISSVSSHMHAVQSDLERLPGTHHYPAQKTMKQSEAVKDVVGNISEEHNQLLEEQMDLASGNTNINTDSNTRPYSVDPETDGQDELMAMAEDSRKAQRESMLGKSPETVERESAAVFQAFLNLPAPFVVISAMFFLWGTFFFPVACAVASYTRSFMATINPLVGLDTIKRLGGIYVKILLMGLIIIGASAIISGILGIVFSAFAMPGLGNLPAKAIGSLFTFYFSVVFSCILGFALFKASDRLSLG